MAVSRFTQLQYSDTGSPVNMEFMHDTLSGLQTKYDQGFLTIANEIDTYNKLEIVTPRDKEYINRRVNSLTEQLNSISNADLADPKTVGKLTLQARSLASDPEIMKRVRNNKNISQLVDRYTKMKEDPKKLEYYNPINEQRDMEYVNQYLRGERDDMPISSPTLYYNYIKDAEK